MPEFSALENVCIPAWMQGKQMSSVRKRAAELLERLNLQHRLTHMPSQLSGGEQQRVAIARALIGNPPVLILDESTSALDPVLEQRLMDRLLPYRKGRTTVFISHRPSMILRADWLIFLEEGRVREQNSPEQLAQSYFLKSFLSAA